MATHPVVVLVGVWLCHLASGHFHSGESFGGGGGGHSNTRTNVMSQKDVTVTTLPFDSSEMKVEELSDCQCHTTKPKDPDETIGHVKINMAGGVVCTNVEPVDIISECKGFCFSKDKPGPFGEKDGGITRCKFCGRTQTFIDVMMKCKKKKYKSYGYQQKEYYETYRQLFKNVALDTGCKCQDCTPQHGYGSMGHAPPRDHSGYNDNYMEYKPEYEQQYQPEYEQQYRPDNMHEYKPQYEQQYKPQYKPEYKPQYKPEYKPKYEQQYKPQYGHEYKPKYEQKYKPEYEQQYKPEYKPDYGHQSKLKYGMGYKPENKQRYKRDYNQEYKTSGYHTPKGEEKPPITPSS